MKNRPVGTAALSHGSSSEILSHAYDIYKLAYESIPVNVAIVGLDRKFLTINKSWSTFLTDHDLTDKDLLQGQYPDVCFQSEEPENAQIRESVEKVLTGQNSDFCFEFVCPLSGRPQWFRSCISPIIRNNEILAATVIHIDITEKKMAQLKSKKAFHEKQRILDVSLDIICAINEEGKFIKINKASRSILGYDPDELLGVHFKDLVYQDDHSGVWEAPDRMMAGEELRNFENRYVRKDGSLVPLAWTAHWDQQDNTLICVGRDNSEKKKAEEQLRINTDKITNLLERITDGFVAVDNTFNITYWNPEAERILGFKAREAIGKNLWAIFPEAIPRKFFSEYKKALTDQTPTHFEEFLPSIQGWLEVNAYPSEDGLSIYFKDITQMIKDKRRLELSERRFRALVQEGSDLIAILDQQGTYQYVSPTIEQVLDLPATHFVGKSVFDFIHRDDRDWVMQHFSLLGVLKQVRLAPFRFLNTPTDFRWIETVATDMCDDPAVGGIVVNSRDITRQINESQEREELIRELTLTNNDLRQFTYITSHNFRAPLSNLIGLLDLMKDIPVEDPTLNELIKGFDTSTHALNSTVNDLINVLIIKGNPSKGKELICIRDLFNKVCDQIGIQILEAEAEIMLDDTAAPCISFDRTYLESIFLNLLTNSIKYRSYQRSLKVDITTSDKGSEVEVVYRDNGIGINMKRYRDRLFGLYQRFHDRPDSKGLGLYLIKSQIESMGGSIQVKSQVDVGTTFTICFKK
ncbi:PAS domain-containing sensor histidine kinase [Telluribacter humicola]|uniref:PAS domain-containing sensor histidine kinase n=1 Tax=Telluribacter humicola TaxID=1720261 RepID=UPI001A9744E4|nr:PAS domain-containing sensor histidine kinase [Telluribacter humicola]